VCGTNSTQPVLQVEANTNLAINNLTVDGPNTCGGADDEGDYGIMVGSWSTGNNGVTFNAVTIENTGGDGLAVYPELATDQGVNTNVTFENGTLNAIGYHGVTLEGVNGFTFAHNTVGNGGNFMDLEVDGYNCLQSTCVNSAGNPVGAGEVNVNILDNTFDGGGWIESTQSCVPVKNWTIEGNTLDSANPYSTFNAPCGTSKLPGMTGFATGLTVANNTDVGGYASDPIDVQGWSNVAITGNIFIYESGWPGVYTTVSDGITTAGSTTVTSATADFTKPASGSSGDSLGAFVTGPGIPANDYITDVISPTSAVLSAPATETGSGLALVIAHSAYALDSFGGAAIGLCGDSNVQIENNTFNNVSPQFANGADCFPTSTTLSTGIVDCGNTYGLTEPYPYYANYDGTLAPAPTADPLTDKACL
jgi:hypothetical protein